MSVVAPSDTAADTSAKVPGGKAASPAAAAVSTPPTPAAPSPVPALSPSGPTPEFPVEWPDDAAPTLHWKRQGSGTPLRPLELDVSLARRRTRPNAAVITGAETAERLALFNGHIYAASLPYAAPAADRLARKASYDRVAGALVTQGETYLERVIFPELDEANARLGAVDVFSVPPNVLAGHLEETLRWYERAWTLHWLRPADDPRERFVKLYQALSGDVPASLLRAVSHEPTS